LLGLTVGLGLHHGLPSTPTVIIGVGVARAHRVGGVRASAHQRRRQHGRGAARRRRGTRPGPAVTGQ
jgi:hypothetical protein